MRRGGRLTLFKECPPISIKMSGTILVYSKYSSHCKTLFEKLRESQVDFKSLYGLKLLCLDNERVRQVLLNNKKIELWIVPTVLVLFPDGVVEKYEGGTAVNWVESKISEHRAAPPEPPREMPRTRLPDVPEENGYDQSPEPPARPPARQPDPPRPPPRQPNRTPPRPAPKKKPVRKPRPPPPEEEEEEEEEEAYERGRTSIEEVEDEDYETESEPEDEPRPPRPRGDRRHRRMRTGGNTEEYNEKLFNDPQPTSAQVPTGAVRGRDGRVNVSSIMAQAQAMQRQREGIEKQPPVGQPPPRGGGF